MAISEAELLAAFRRLQKPLYNVLYRWLWQAQDCEDLMQDAFLKVWDQRQVLQVQNLDALIYASALNLAKNRLRWRALWRFGEISPETPTEEGESPGSQAQRHQREQALKRVLDGFDRDSRNLVLLSECAGLSTDELVAVFDWPAGTVASRKHRVLARLRVELGALGFDESKPIIEAGSHAGERQKGAGA
ncbi:MAG: RNA polymerase sigma factor [Lysobacterales bacterium]